MNFIFSGKFYLIICFVFNIGTDLKKKKENMHNWNKTEWAQDRSFQNKIWCFSKTCFSKCLLCLWTSIFITTVTQQTHLRWPSSIVRGGQDHTHQMCILLRVSPAPTSVKAWLFPQWYTSGPFRWPPFISLFQHDDVKALRAREPLAYVGQTGVPAVRTSLHPAHYEIKKTKRSKSNWRAKI